MFNTQIVRFSILTLVFAFSAVIFAQDAPKKRGFIGAEACGMCHKSEKQGKQLDIWKASKHAKAFEALTSDKAKAIAKEKGLKTDADKAPECLKCHVSGHDYDASLLGKKFRMEDGVQCETCHGAGADYKDMKIMKNKEEAIKNGLNVPTEKEKFCTGCHNSESPTFKSFNYDSSWAQIKHPVPAKEQK